MYPQGVGCRVPAERSLKRSALNRIIVPSRGCTCQRVERSGFKAHRLLYHSTLGLRVIKKKKKVWISYCCGEQIRKALSSDTENSSQFKNNYFA